VTVVAVSELSQRFPRAGALLLSLPLTSLLALAFSWHQHGDLKVVAKLAQETSLFVILGLPLFLPLAFAAQTGWGFWPSLIAGIGLAFLAVGAWALYGN
jgi:hypothetical protein